MARYGDLPPTRAKPDGSNYFTGFVIDRNTGRLKPPLAPKFSAYTNFDNYIAANAWTKVQFNNADSNDQNAFNQFYGAVRRHLHVWLLVSDQGSRHVLQERR